MAEYSISGCRLLDVHLMGGVKPSLVCTVEAHIPNRFGNEAVKILTFTGYAGHLVVRAPSQELRLAPLSPDRTDYLYAGRLEKIPFSVWLDSEALERLEQMRMKGDGHLRFAVAGNYIGALGWISPSDVPVFTGPHTFTLSVGPEFRYVRDDWLNALEVVGHKMVRIYEAPHVPLPSDWNVVQHLDKAWAVLHQGNPDDAMQECQKALEGIKKVAETKGFVRKGEDGKDRIDFQRLTSSATLGETLDAMFTAAWGFQQPGRHHGKAIRYADGEYALLSVQALVNYVSRLLSAGSPLAP